MIYPSYICFNQTLCERYQGNISYKNFSCFHRNEIDLISSISGKVWIDIILSIDLAFRSCFIQLKFLNNLHQYENHSSLYQCENSSKLISKSRILDENLDCASSDDENEESSCLINARDHIKCANEKKCLSLLYAIDNCLLNKNVFHQKVPFRHLHSGLKEFLSEDSMTKRILTNESNEENWLCRNLYSRCDGIWNCPNGADERNCTKNFLCSIHNHPCLSISHHLFPIESNHDGIEGSLGDTNKIHFCKCFIHRMSDPCIVELVTFVYH